MRVSKHLVWADALDCAADAILRISADVDCQCCRDVLRAGKIEVRYKCVKCHKLVCKKCRVEKRGRPKDRLCVCRDHGQTMPLPLDAARKAT